MSLITGRLVALVTLMIMGWFDVVASPQTQIKDRSVQDLYWRPKTAIRRPILPGYMVGL